MKELLLKTIYGNFKVKEPLIELINHKTIQRLKKIGQRGATDYYKKYNTFISRYDHSIGVLFLLIKYNAELPTQIAGLLHDSSHTVFSHVGEMVFDHKGFKSSYQDDIHEWFLKEQKIDTILHKYQYSLDEILHKNGNHKLLEQDLPDICIDRLEYNLRIGYFEKIITQNDINEILNDLTFENNKWFFTDINTAIKFANISLEKTKGDWADHINLFAYQQLAEAIKTALDSKIINLNDIHFSTDDIIWNKLIESNDQKITTYIKKLKEPQKYITLSFDENYDSILHGKFRGIDPLIKTDNDFQRLSELNSSFKQKYNDLKSIIYSGWKVKYL